MDLKERNEGERKKKILDFSFLQPHPGPMAEGQLLSTIILLITKLGERTGFAPAACVWPEHGLRPSASFLTFWPRLTQASSSLCSPSRSALSFPIWSLCTCGPLWTTSPPRNALPPLLQGQVQWLQETLQVMPARIRSCRSPSQIWHRSLDMRRDIPTSQAPRNYAFVPICPSSR